jgi:hypothetical protein
VTALIYPLAIAGIFALLIGWLLAHDRSLKNHPDVQSVDEFTAARDELDRLHKEQQ